MLLNWTLQNASQNYTIVGVEVTFQAGGGIFMNGGMQLIDNNLCQTGGTADVIITAGALPLAGTNTLTGGIRIDPGATLQLGNGGITGSIVATTAITDNGLLRFDYSNTINGIGNVEIAAGTAVVTGTGSISNSSLVFDNGTFYISGMTAGTSIKSLSGSGAVDLGGHTLTLTKASGILSGAMADGGENGGAGGRLT